MDKPYVIGFKHAAVDQLKRLDRPVVERILVKLLWLARNVETIPHNALTGQWIGFYRIRIGDYRVIYRLEHDESLIIVDALGHRREIYDD
jgi:mRNA interferase RelE/StbE